jgi:asparagine synthase (glutamine-hydrolysing)
MCGIAGLCQLAGDDLDPASLASLSSVQRHRGPDDAGFLGYRPGLAPMVGRRADVVQGAMLGLAHLRLSILDLSPAGFQPMSTPDGHYWIVFNGEIYNYLELRSELELLGHTFRTQTDTEVILAAHAQWGKQALNRFVGMFAFALLDARKNRLLLTRDFFGIKPLYYRWDKNSFAFASELKALLQLPNASRQAQPQRLYEYLRFGLTDHGEDTLFVGYHQLPAAHYIELDLNHPVPASPIRYWQLDLHDKKDIGFDEAAIRLRELFLKSVDLHLRSDVPVGACLSGGIDSSAIVSAMRHLRGESLDLHVFTYVADENDICEERWADMAARSTGAKIHKIRPHANELYSDLRRMIGIHDEPFGSTSIYAQYRLFQLIHAHKIKVVLDGQGADELLGGYNNYQGTRFASLLHQGKWADAARFWKTAASYPQGRYLLFYAGEYLLPETLQNPFRRFLGKDLLPTWLDGEWFLERGVRLHPPRQFNKRLHEELHESLKVNLLPLLRYEDRNSMAFSVESRVPFLTPELARFLLNLPEEYIIAPDGTTKAVFRKAMRGLVPDPILNRRDKVGFATPERNWLMTNLSSWLEGTFNSPAARRIPAFVPSQLNAAWARAKRHPRQFGWHFWRCVNLILWAEAYNVVF